MTSTATYDQGLVIVVNVPFSNGTGFKARPAVVISTKRFHRRLPDLVICPISSQPRLRHRPGPGDYPITNWKTTGLRHPSTVRISKLLSIDKRLIKRPLKRLSAEDLQKVQQSLRVAVGI